MTSHRVVRDVLTDRFKRLAAIFDAFREEFVPKTTGRAASALFSRVDYDSAVPRVVLQAGYHHEIAPYVDFLDFGTGVHHYPDPHPPWLEQQGRERHRRVLATVAPFTHPGGSMGGLLEVHV